MCEPTEKKSNFNYCTFYSNYTANLKLRSNILVFIHCQIPAGWWVPNCFGIWFRQTLEYPSEYESPGLEFGYWEFAPGFESGSGRLSCHCLDCCKYYRPLLCCSWEHQKTHPINISKKILNIKKYFLEQLIIKYPGTCKSKKLTEQ